MEKSEIYKFAQMSVVNDAMLGSNVKLEVIRELQHLEFFAKMMEEKDGSDDAHS